MHQFFKKMGYKVIATLLITECCFLTLPVYAVVGEATYVWSSQSSSVSNSQEEKTEEPFNTTVTQANAETEKQEDNKNTLELESEGAILIEQNSGKILYEKNCHAKLRPASVTKIMSILLIMEALDSDKIALDTKIPCTEDAAAMGGSQIWLDPREELSVDEMLKAVFIVSANDCTVALADYLEGSQEAFVAKMNEKAQELGMKDTTFKNCHGIDEDGHETSPYDIALMSRELLTKHPQVMNYTTIWMDTLRDGKSQLVNTNKLIRNYRGATGLKTGSTALALYNLSASATRDELSLIAVIQKAPSTKVRFAEAQKLLDYGFSNYSYQGFAKKGDTLKTIKVHKGIESEVIGVYEQDAGTLLKKGQEKNLTENLQLEENLQAPIEKGQKIGSITYEVDGQKVGEVSIVAQKEVKKITWFNMITHLVTNWFCMLRD